MHWCRQLFCPSGPSKVLGFSDGPDLAQTPSLQHAGGVARGAPCAPRRGLRGGIGGPVHTSPWDGMGWGARAPFPLGWDGMGWGAQCTLPLDRLFFRIHSLSPAAHLATGLPLIALEIMSTWLIPSFSAS